MGFIKEIYSGNRAGLVVAFKDSETTNDYFNGDSVAAAMKHFHMYTQNNNIYIQTEDSVALENLSIKPEDANEFRATVDAIIVTLTDEQAIAAPVLFPIWQPDIDYSIGDRVRYDNKLYKVIQNHTSQPTWTPLESPSLFASLLTSNEGDVLDWVQPDSINTYMIGDKVRYDGKIYESLIDNNSWSPAEYPAGWAEATE